MNKIYKFKSFFTLVLLLGSSLVIKAQNIDHWEMVVAADDTWHYFPGDSEPQANWADNDFDTSIWPSGPGGIGYGDGDDGTPISPVPSVYIRKNFNLIDTSIISWAILHVDYDDAFVAYLNGHEIARANIGTFGDRPSNRTYATEPHEAQIHTGGIPDRFIIKNDSLKKHIIEGENVLALQIHNSDANSSDLSSTTFFSVGIVDASSTYRQVPDWFNDPLSEKSNIPLVIIETNGQTIVDEPKITAWMKIVDNGVGKFNSCFDEATDYDGYIGIEIRGQSSQMFPKKSFSVETRNETGDGINVSLLGMPSEEDWVLYAPYSDKTMLRNALSYHLGRKMGDWQPRYKFCEVYLNGSYHGVYMLIEKIKRDGDRVDINKLKPDEISGDNLTGGYILKVDKIHDLSSDEYFYTHPVNSYHNARNYAFTYVYPKFDDIAEEQKTYIFDYLLNLENTLNGSSFSDPENGFRKYMDINSFVDFQLINELTNNVDGYRYSTYFYKKKDSNGGKLFAGPLWDFNLGFGNVDYAPINLATDEWLYPNYGPNEGYPMHWWSRLMEDADYQNSFASRWGELREGSFKTDSIMEYLTDTIAYLGDAIDRNFNRWPILGEYVWPNYFIGDTYQQEIDYLKTWIANRLDWMDANISFATDIFEQGKQENRVMVFPNPINELINIQFSIKHMGKIKIEIVNMQGKKVFVYDYSPYFEGKQTIKLKKPKLAPAYYLLNIRQKDQIIGVRKLLINN